MIRTSVGFTCPPGCWPEKDICYCPDTSFATRSTMRHPPYSRGVQHLMYVGDDQAGAPAPAASGLSTRDKVMGALALLGALQTKGALRVASVGIASWITYKALHGRGLV